MDIKYFSIITTSVLLIFCTAGKSFQFESPLGFDYEVSTVLKKGDLSLTHLNETHYIKEEPQCHKENNEIILSFVSKLNDWTVITKTEKDRIFSKLSKYFGLPKDSINLSFITKDDIKRTKLNLIRIYGNNYSKDLNPKALSKIDFIIGCSNKKKLLITNVEDQIKENAFYELTEPITGWWELWEKPHHSGTIRYRRNIEGSGEDDYNTYDYEDEDDDDDGEPFTEIPTEKTHAHRHSHGTTKDKHKGKNSEKIGVEKEKPSFNEVEINSKYKKNDIMNKNQSLEIKEDIKQSVSKLESDIIKTIENTKNIPNLSIDITENNNLNSNNSYKYNLNTIKPSDDYIIEDILTENFSETITLPTTKLLYNQTNIPLLNTEITKEQSVTQDIYNINLTQSITTSTPKIILKNTHNNDTLILSSEESNTHKNNKSIIIITTEFNPSNITIIETTTQVFIPTEKVENQTTKEEISKVTTPLIPIDFSSPISEISENEILEPNTTPVSIDNNTSTEKTSVTTSTTEKTTERIVSTTTTTTTARTTTTTTEIIEQVAINTEPIIKNRLPKQAVTAGKAFSIIVPLETFYDKEDGTNLTLALYDKEGKMLKPTSWILFKPETREIYGLPLEDMVSRWQYKLAATDSKNGTVNETFDISVQQYKGHRSMNHEIIIIIKLNQKFENNIDWQINLIKGIAETLGDKTLSNIVVREIRQNQQDPNTATFVYANETLPKDKCPEELLTNLIKRLDQRRLTNLLNTEIIIKSIDAQPTGPCQKPQILKPKPTPHLTKNYPPVPRNQVDRVNATIGQLLVFKVPTDTFYDPEDNTDLKLSLLTKDRKKLHSKHWLQFDSKNQEFFGVPKYGDFGMEEYLLVAEDHEGLTATDALIVVVNHPPKRDYSALFKITLGISYDTFNNSHMQRKFLERISQILGSSSTSIIQIKSIQHLNDSGHITVNFYNTTLYRIHHRCPDEEIEMIRNSLVYPDNTIRENVRKTIGNEFNILNINIVPVGSCHVIIDNSPHEIIPIKTENKETSSFTDDYLLTFILPAIIILAMLLLASIIACVLHRRRLTGKMELGDEEERKSFRSKGIPVIFQDELDEKPDIGNKSPIILKDEKPPLLPPSYNSTNFEGENDVDEYVPPPAVMMTGRETRGKSPVTPSYRKPPPYVSP